MVCIIQRDRHRRIPQRFSQLCTGKNNILHIAATQLLGTLFTQYPAHRIGNITFSAAIWSYNTSDTVMELKFNFIGKGLKSLYLDAL